MDEKQLLATRQEKDQLFKSSLDSPLTAEQQAKFNGLSYYPPNPDLDLTLSVEKMDNPGTVTIETTSGDTRTYRRYGQIKFTVDGQEVRLTIFDSTHGFFLPFVDANAGTETYAAGRYLEPEYLGGGKFRVDFNQAYSPFCCYGPGWSCPVTPPENRLKVAIRAGERMPQGEWVGKA
jgi:uncharacterized protein